MPAALGRLPLMTWARNRDEYRAEFARVLGGHGDRPEALDLLVIPASAIRGFPAEVMAAGIAKRRLHRDEGVPVWIHSYRAWLAVDPVRAERALPARAAGGPGFGRERTRLMLLAEVAGLQGDWARLDGIFKALLETEGQADRQVRAIMAFWLAVQGRYDQASASLELAGAMPDERNPPVLGNDRLRGLMETAMVRIFRGTGRQAEAQRLVSGLLPQLRAEWRANRSTCKWDGWMLAPMRYASLAANEGLEEEAVGAIRDSLRCGDLPYGFWPQLPWFKSLEGYAPYDEIVRERERRIERISAELATLEAQNGGPTPGMQ